MNILVFAGITVLLCGAQFQINGRIIESPTEIIASIPNTFFLVLGCLAFLIVTVAVNIMANFVAPAFVLSNLAPEIPDFRRAGLISATIAVLILPWNLYNSPLVIVYFLVRPRRPARPAVRGDHGRLLACTKSTGQRAAVVQRRSRTALITTAAGSICAPWRRSFLPR